MLEMEDIKIKEEILDELDSSLVVEEYHVQPPRYEDLKQEEDIKQEETTLNEIEQISFKYETQEYPNEFALFEMSELATTSQDQPDLKHKCTMCPASYQNHIELQKHKTNSHRKECFNCKFCSKIFVQKESLNVHLLEHKKRRSVKCCVCNKTVKNQHSLEVHKQLNGCYYYCAICGLKCKSRVTIAAHLKYSHFNNKPFVCKICNCKLDKKIALERHEATHRRKAMAAKANEKLHRNSADNDLPAPNVPGRYGKVYKRKKKIETIKSENQDDVPMEITNFYPGSGDDSEEIFEDLENPQKLEKILSVKLHYECGYCYDTFPTIQEIRRHISFHEGQLLPEDSLVEYRTAYVCNICNTTIKSQDSLQDHLKQHVKDKYTFKCEHCYKGFSSKEKLAKHLKQLHFMKKTHKCRYCNKKFHILSFLQRHLSTHENKDLKCFYCEMVFRKVETFEDHITKDHYGLPLDPINDPLCCTICNDDFEYLEDLKKHVRIHLVKESYLCPICKKNCSTANEIINHFSLNHSGMHRPDDFPNSSKIYTCRYTGKIVAGPKKALIAKSDNDSAKNLYFLLKTAKDRDTRMINLLNRLERNYECSVCNQILKTDAELAEHNHMGYKNYFCAQCPKVFSSKKNLRTHMPLHASPIYKCGICQKTLRCTSYMKIHMQTHSNHICGSCKNCTNDLPCEKIVVWYLSGRNKGNKRYVCTICSKTYMKKKNFRLHCSRCVDLLKISSTTFGCRTCDKVFESYSSLNAHTLVHYLKVIKCFYCCKIYSTELKLETHVANDHQGLPVEPKAPFACTICHESHETLNDLKKHVKVHSVKEVWECGFCGQSHSTENSLRDHVQENHKGKTIPSGFPNVWKKLTCPFTGKTFSTKNERPFKCSNFLSNFKTKLELTVDEKRHSDNEDLKKGLPCTHCGIIFSTQESRMNHEKQHVAQHEKDAIEKMFVLLKKAVSSNTVVKGRDSSK